MARTTNPHWVEEFVHGLTGAQRPYSPRAVDPDWARRQIESELQRRPHGPAGLVLHGGCPGLGYPGAEVPSYALAPWATVATVAWWRGTAYWWVRREIVECIPGGLAPFVRRLSRDFAAWLVDPAHKVWPRKHRKKRT